MEKVIGTNRRHVMSCSSLTSDSVVNSKGENLGKVEDIMIHLDSGRVAYAVLSFGGILGIGDKLFAIPWDMLTLDEDEKHFILEVDKEKLESAPGFDKENWPDMADPDFGRQLFSYYDRQQPSWMTGDTEFRKSTSDCIEMGTC